MKPRINMIGILANDVPKLAVFYRDVLGFKIMSDYGEHVEFESEGVRFAISTKSVMRKVTGHPSYDEPNQGHAFELAFLADSPKDVDRVYEDLVAKGATPIKSPADMPWGQRTGFFADPEGNIHEVFANLES